MYLVPVQYSSNEKLGYNVCCPEADEDAVDAEVDPDEATRPPEYKFRQKHRSKSL